MRLNRPITYVMIVALAVIATFPLRTLVAEIESGRVASILDDPATDGRDVVSVSAETLPQYAKAEAALKAAISLDPANSRNHRTLADVYIKLGSWAEAMEAMEGHAPRDGKADLAHAVEELQTAIRLEPSNPDYHLALGTLYDLAGREPYSSTREYEAAALFGPHNSALRYAVAMRYLLTGRSEKALLHAKVLAGIDESYVVPDSPAKRNMLARRTSGYLLWLSNTYLYRSLDIANRVAKMNLEQISALVPKSADAQEVMQLFLEQYGIQ